MNEGNATAVLAFTSCMLVAGMASCARSRNTIEISMYDGWSFERRSDRLVQVPKSSTTFVVSVFDEGSPKIIDDESWTYYEFSVPDQGRRELPITFSVSGERTVATVWSSESKPFSQGSFTVSRAVPGGFIASYDLGSGGEHITGRGIARPEGNRRSDVWPYDPREPQPSHVERIIQAVKDAWNGAI